MALSTHGEQQGSGKPNLDAGNNSDDFLFQSAFY